MVFNIPKNEDIIFVDRRRAPRRRRPVSVVEETIIKKHSHRPTTPVLQTHRHSTSLTEIHHAPPSPPPPPPPPPVVYAPPPPQPTYIPPPPPASVYVPPSPIPSYRSLSPFIRAPSPNPEAESRVELIKVEEEHWIPPVQVFVHEQSTKSSSKSHSSSGSSVSTVSRKKSRRGSVSSYGGSHRERERERDREELYIQRERIIERASPPRAPTPEVTQSGYRTVEGTGWDCKTPSGYRVVEGGGRRGSGVGVVNMLKERGSGSERGSRRGSESDYDGGRRRSVTFAIENGVGARREGRFTERERVTEDVGAGRRREFYRRG